MIEIKCTEDQKEVLLKAIVPSSYCVVEELLDCPQDCFNCLDKNIKWTIRGNEDAE